MTKVKSISKFFSNEKATFIKENKTSVELFDKELLSGLEQSAELTRLISQGENINDICKSIWADLCGDEKYQITVFDTATIRGISEDVFKNCFEAVTANKCRALMTISEIKSKKEYKDFKDQLTGLKSGAYKSALWQGIVRHVTALSNKAGNNVPTGSKYQWALFAKSFTSKVATEKLSEVQIQAIILEMEEMKKALLKGEVMEYKNITKEDKSLTF